MKIVAGKLLMGPSKSYANTQLYQEKMKYSWGESYTYYSFGNGLGLASIKIKYAVELGNKSTFNLGSFLGGSIIAGPILGAALGYATGRAYNFFLENTDGDQYVFSFATKENAANFRSEVAGKLYMDFSLVPQNLSNPTPADNKTQNSFREKSIKYAEDLAKEFGEMQDKSKYSQTSNSNSNFASNRATNPNASPAALLKRTELFLSDKDWSSATAYANSVLDIVPENSAAYLYLAMAELKSSSLKTFLENPLLKNLEKFINNNKNFNRAMKFDDDDTTPDEFKIFKANYHYNAGSTMLDLSYDLDALIIAAKHLSKARGYKDADDLLKKCYRKIGEEKDRILNEAINESQENSIDKLEDAIKLLKSIPGWRDADERLRIANDKWVGLKRDERLKEGVDKQNEDTIDSLTEAIKIFHEILGWKDADEHLRIANDRLEALQSEVNDEKLQAGIDKQNEDTIDSLTEAIKIFREIPGWKDADEHLRIANDRLEALQSKVNDEKLQAGIDKQNEDTIDSLNRAIEIFCEIPGWKDVDERIESCSARIKELTDKKNKEIAAAEQLRKQQERQQRNKKIIIGVVVLCLVIAAAVGISLFQKHQTEEAIIHSVEGKAYTTGVTGTSFSLDDDIYIFNADGSCTVYAPENDNVDLEYSYKYTITKEDDEYYLKFGRDEYSAYLSEDGKSIIGFSLEPKNLSLLGTGEEGKKTIQKIKDGLIAENDEKEAAEELCSTFKQNLVGCKFVDSFGSEISFGKNGKATYSVDNVGKYSYNYYVETDQEGEHYYAVMHYYIELEIANDDSNDYFEGSYEVTDDDGEKIRAFIFRHNEDGEVDSDEDTDTFKLKKK